MHTRKKPTSQESATVESLDELLRVDFDDINNDLDRELSRPRLIAALEMLDRGTRPPIQDIPIETRTRHTTIRLPADVLNAYRAESARRGVGYQTLIIEVLRQNLVVRGVTT